MKTIIRFIFIVRIHRCMITPALTDKEKEVLFGLANYPGLADKQLAKQLDLKHSTVTAIRHRLHANDYVRTFHIPQLHCMGCNIMVVTYTNFSPLISLDERIDITGRTIEVFEEIFFSAGEQDKGFSFSFAKDYATIGRINDIRTKTFGERGFLENEYPNMVVLPFEISKFYRFFDFAPLLKNSFSVDASVFETTENIHFPIRDLSVVSETEKNVYYMLIKYPEASDTNIGRELGISRHTVSRLRRRFEEEHYFHAVKYPNLTKIGYEILAFYHMHFDPKNPPDIDEDDALLLLGDSTIFCASRMFEAVMLSVYTNYEEYKKDKTRIMQVLKENRWVVVNPMVRTYSLHELIYIKDFKFAPITKKTIGCDLVI